MGSLFIFIGLPKENSDTNILVLWERLEKKFLNNEISIRFTRKQELLSARLDNVSFYISLLKNRSELKDWYQAAIDGELMLDKKPVTMGGLQKRYQKLKNNYPAKYKKIHYATALVIMEEMEKFSEMEIFSFQ